jgi:ring-1,2-phenylacetyl-CoA epoxidase subunit PaaC
MTPVLPKNLQHSLAQLLLSIADDKLMLGHRNSDWTGLGPILEEDIAFSHLAQDEIAHAQAIYEFVGTLLNRRADDLAFGRHPQEYRCAHIVEVPDEFDWATAITRQFLCDHFDRLRLEALSQSSHKPLADLSRRIAAEEQVHVEHSDGWMKRLGAANSQAHDRMQHAIDALAPLVMGMFEPIEGQIEGQQLLSAAGVYPTTTATLYKSFAQSITPILADARLKLTLPPTLAVSQAGRSGIHTPHLKALLDEMCEVYRTEPGVAW